MSSTETASQIQCENCNSFLPLSATFCGKCGARTTKDESSDENDFAADDQTVRLSADMDVATRYRVTSLIRRRPSIQLAFALDTQQQRLIMLRDIDISALDASAQAEAYQAFQQEYALLETLSIADITPLLALYHEQGHLYSVADLQEKEEIDGKSRRPSTLQDLLQSGIGLPDQQIAIDWIIKLAQAIEHLHQQQIIIGELDPDTILISNQDYSGQPRLTISWIPMTIHQLLPSVLHPANPSSFCAPEMSHKKIRDIYSLGALLYLLLTGTAPEAKELRSPRDFNYRINPALEALVMRALALEPAERFQSAQEMAEALLHLDRSTIRRTPIIFPRLPKSVAKFVKETIAPSNGDHNETEGDNIADKPTQILSKSAIQGENAEQSMIIYEEATQLLSKDAIHDEIKQAQEEPIASSPASTETGFILINEDKSSSDENGDLSPDRIVTLPVASAQFIAPEEEPAQTSEEEPAQPSQALQPLSPPHPILPTFFPLMNKGKALARIRDLFIETRSALIQYIQEEKKERSLLQHVQRFIVGEQKHSTSAAALIETPMRVQPMQSYIVRIQIIGRDEVKDAEQTGGLSVLVQGDRVHIEVRLSLYQSSVYMVQQADVKMPACGYAAEVLMPIYPFAGGTNSRRDRLHILFTDGEGHPLYERPFVIELFVSHLVQAGHEGHNVLSIPI